MSNKSILSLKPSQAQKYFLESSSYCTLPLPPYINFDKILKFVKSKVGKIDMSSCYKIKPSEYKNASYYKSKPSEYENASYYLFTRKDSKYTYRKFQLPNPYSYYFLVREITSKKNWDLIKERFNEFENPNCDVVSLPVTKAPKQKRITGTMINKWWEEVEQKSIQLSLEYKYIFVSDISNCYSSIYTHSIAWALHGKKEAKVKRDKSLLGNIIDGHIMGLQYGQTNGIPTGSILFDFIAEIVLGYADEELYLSLRKKNISEYKIIRYRDDYKIFSNNKEDLEKIALELQNVLSELNLQLNSSKTFLSEDIITSSIKKDKLYYIANTPIYKGATSSFTTIQKELLFIRQISKKFPNTGIVMTLLDKVYDRLADKGVCENENFREDETVLIAIIVDIAINNPNSYPMALGIVSYLINELKDNNTKRKQIEMIIKKLEGLPMIGYIEIWMQRLSFNILPIDSDGYSEKICKVVNGTTNIELWDNSWMDDKYTEGFPLLDICDTEVLSEIPPVFDKKEFSTFGY